MSRIMVLFLSLVVASLLLGCSAKESGGEMERSALSTATELVPYRVEEVDASGVSELISQRNGKVLFLNLWATWCQPCVEEFPDIVELAGEMSGADIEFVAISFDYPDEVESKIQPFLRDNKVTFRVLVANPDDPEAFINALEPRWNGAIPTTLIYDAHGKQQSFLVGKRDYDQFKQAIAKARQSS